MLYVSSFRTLFSALAVTAGLFLSPLCSYAGTNVKSYREWKVSQIQDSQIKIKNIKERLSVDPNLSKTGSTEGGLKAELEKEVQRLSVTEDLTITDYFVGYLTKQPSLDTAIREVSGRLTSEEVAELMSAYAQRFFQSRPSTLKASSRADSSP